MSEEQLKAFIERVQGDDNLQAKLKAGDFQRYLQNDTGNCI